MTGGLNEMIFKVYTNSKHSVILCGKPVQHVAAAAGVWTNFMCVKANIWVVMFDSTTAEGKACVRYLSIFQSLYFISVEDAAQDIFSQKQLFVATLV